MTEQLSVKEISWDEFVEKYKPVKNAICENASYGGRMFETFGAEYDFIKQQLEDDKTKIWTVVDTDGCMIITSGWHYVNRVGYLVTEITPECEIEVFDKIDEFCPHCEQEVKLKEEFIPQICPNCNEQILPCSMCNMDEVDCSKCELEELKGN